MKINDLDNDGKFLFYSAMKAAIKVKRLGKDKKFFLDFADGIWETLELNDIDELEETLQSSLINDVLKLVKK